MTTIPTIVITPSTAAEAYGRTAKGIVTDSSDASAPSFGDTITQAAQQAVATGQAADTQAINAINGGGNLTDVVTALSQAQLTLQTATAIRDRVVQAYQDIMKMPI
jgi:flagellar hook-basal body complex protein FliE